MNKITKKPQSKAKKLKENPEQENEKPIKRKLKIPNKYSKTSVKEEEAEEEKPQKLKSKPGVKSRKTSIKEDEEEERPVKRKFQKPYGGVEEGQQVLKLLAKDIELDFVSVRQSNIFKPTYYGNSRIARYRLAAVMEDKKQKNFIEIMDKYKKKEDVENYRFPVRAADERGFAIFLGKSYLNFQSREQPKIITSHGDTIDLTEEIPPKTIVSIKFDLYLYYNLRFQRNAFNLKLTLITIHLDSVGHPLTEFAGSKKSTRRARKG